MKMLQIIASALVAAFALSAVLAATASAETLTYLLAEILVGGSVPAGAGGVEAVAKAASPNGNCSIGGTGSSVNTPVAGNLSTSPIGIVQLSSGA